MALNANKAQSGGARAEPLDPANYPARIVQVIDLGVQPQRAFEGKEKAPAQELMITYELGTEFLKDDDGNDDEEKPRWISERFALFNLAADKAKSTKRYNSLDPKGKFGGDWSQMAGCPCLVAIVNNEKNGKVYNNVGGVSLPIKGMAVPELVNPARVFDLDDPDMDTFNAFPDWIKSTIVGNLQYEGSVLQKRMGGQQAEAESLPVDDVEEDDVPF